MNLKSRAIILVADGSRMLLLRNEGDAVHPALKVVEHRAFLNPPNRDLLGDAPGLTYSSGGFNRSSYDDSDPHQRNEISFAVSAAQLLAEVANEGEDIVVVAPPQTLAVLRRHYDDAIKSRLVAEIDKDLTKHPVEEITKLLVGYA